jgi:hypothetical protein
MLFSSVSSNSSELTLLLAVAAAARAVLTAQRSQWLSVRTACSTASMPITVYARVCKLIH